MKLLASIAFVFLCTSCNWANDFPVVVNKTTSYAIVIPTKATPNEIAAAKALQKYILESTGVTLLIANENVWINKLGFFVGNTIKSKTFNVPKLEGEGYYIASHESNVLIYGNSGKGVIYGTYAFIEKYLGGIKMADEPGKVTEYKLWELPQNFSHSYSPIFIYRQAYYPQSNDPEYLDWHKLHKFEDLWGIWGHSYFKLVSPKKYFNSNPDFFALENGVRKPTQLCPSNANVLQIAIDELRLKMADNPDAMYWSVSAEDDIGYCQCATCKQINREEGTPTGAHLRFVNNVAQAFPHKYFTTLAYTYTLKAPLKTKPANNVFVMLSTIDAFRTNALETEPTAAGFRNALLAWEKITSRIFVWDYTTQFTNYLAPFPDLFNLAPNINYLSKHQVKGVFSQGCGDTYGEMAELKSYIISKLLWNPELNTNQLLEEFCNNYYKSAGKQVLEYINLIQTESRKTNRHIDIYGNPINEHNSYLTPLLLDNYSTIFDKAEAVAEENEKVLNRIYKARMPFDYVVLQQARFYGTEKNGYLIKQEDGLGYIINPKFLKKVEKFVATAEKYKVTELSEGGLTPKQYLTEWQQLIAKGWKPNLALGSKVNLQFPFVQDYPAKGERTLVDETIGLTDFSYNWLCFYGTDMIATIDMQATKEVSSIETNFLDDPRHWIFLPQELDVWVSVDGQNYTKTTASTTNPTYNSDEHFEAKSCSYKFTIQPQTARYIKLLAKNQTTIPEWRFRPNKKPMIACDEIYVH